MLNYFKRRVNKGVTRDGYWFSRLSTPASGLADTLRNKISFRHIKCNIYFAIRTATDNPIVNQIAFAEAGNHLEVNNVPINKSF